MQFQSSLKQKIVEWFNDIHYFDENEILRIRKRVVIMFSTNNLASKILMFSKKITTWIRRKFFILMGLLISAIRYSFWSELDHVMPSTTHHWYCDFQITNNYSFTFLRSCLESVQQVVSRKYKHTLRKEKRIFIFWTN